MNLQGHGSSQLADHMLNEINHVFRKWTKHYSLNSWSKSIWVFFQLESSCLLLEDLFVKNTSINPRGKCRLGYQIYTNSFFNANSFYVNFTNMTFQKIPIPHLTCMYSDSFSIAHFASCCISLLWLTQYFRRKKVALTKELVYIF